MVSNDLQETYTVVIWQYKKYYTQNVPLVIAL